MIAENPPQTTGTPPGPKAVFLSKSTIQPGKWYRLRPRPDEPTILGAVLKTLVGVAVGGLAYSWGAHQLAVVIWVISGLIGLVSLSSQKARSGVSRFFATLGRWVGWILGTLLLAPVYLIGFTLARIIGRLAGRDPLYLRDTTAQTFWLPADQDRRTVRHIRSLYATEVPTKSSRMGVIAAASVLGLLLVGEIVSRLLGFGTPILYLADEQAAYFPAPNQESMRYGGRIKINSYGMRGPDMERAKKPGTLRIFMIGDSTLWGGSYVDQADIYARLIDDSLDKKPGANDVEIWNMGVNGWGPFQEVGYVDKFGTFDADVAVVTLPIGDIYRGPLTLASTPYFPADSPPNFGLVEIGHHLLWRLRGTIKGPPSTENEAVAGRNGIEKYVELAKMLQAKGAEVIFAVLPGREAGMTGKGVGTQEQDVEQLRAALAPLGIPVDFPLGLFENKGTTDDIYFDVCHLRGPGHHVYADHLKSLLEKTSEKLRAHREARGDAAATTTPPTEAAKEGAKQ